MGEQRHGRLVVVVAVVAARRRRWRFNEVESRLGAIAATSGLEQQILRTVSVARQCRPHSGSAAHESHAAAVPPIRYSMHLAALPLARALGENICIENLFCKNEAITFFFNKWITLDNAQAALPPCGTAAIHFFSFATSRPGSLHAHSAATLTTDSPRAASSKSAGWAEPYTSHATHPL